MSFIIILLVIGFTNSIHSSILDFCTNVTEPMLNVSLLRHKRERTEYTRWRPNQLTTQEFIVKVLDDDIPTTTVKEIVAVNILDTTRNMDKIIVGGVVVPSPTTTLTVEQLSEYTRFIPRSLMADSRGHKDLFFTQASVTSGSKIATFPSKVIIPPYPQYKFGLVPERDESPPASPQFVARTPTLIARQYAPITPVVFTQRSSPTHLTPPTIERRTFSAARLKPSRTPPMPNVMPPSRTTFHESEFVNFNAFDDEELKSDQIYVSRSTFVPTVIPERTREMFNIFKARDNTLLSTPKFIEYTTVSQKAIVKKIDEDKYFDSPYGMMFYNEEDNETVITEHTNYRDDSEKQRIEIKEELTNTTLTYTDASNEVMSGETEKNKEFESDFENATLSISNLNDTEFVILKPLKVSHIVKHNCSLLKLRTLNFKSPRTLPEVIKDKNLRYFLQYYFYNADRNHSVLNDQIFAQLKHWAETSPIAKWTDVTSGNYTLMENPIYMMIVDDPSSGQITSAKNTVMVVAGIQGRDHHAVSAALYLLYQLIERTEVHTDLLSKFRFWIIPVFNPDGYDYSITFPHRREWTKNLRQNWETSVGRDPCSILGLRCSIKPCYGVNLDRNFEYQWIPTEELRAEHPCGDLYAGTRQLSEAETLALTRYLHALQAPLHTFIAFKEGDVLGIMYPYSHTKKARAFDHVYRQRASRAASAAYGISGRPYVAGQTSQFLPLYAGGIEDWVDGHLGIDNTYTVMMFRPTDSYNSKYVTERVVHEAYAALDTLLLHSVEPVLAPPVVTLSRSKGILGALPFTITNIYCSSMLNIITGILISI